MFLKTLIDCLLHVILKIVQFYYSVACYIIGSSCDNITTINTQNNDNSVISTQKTLAMLSSDIDRDMLKQLENLQEDLNIYKDIARDAEEAKVAAERTRDSIYNSWKFTTSQLESALLELRTVKSANAFHSEEKQLMQMELNKLTSEVKQQTQIHEMNMLLMKENATPTGTASNWRLLKDSNQNLKDQKVASAKTNRLIRSTKKLKLALKTTNLNDENMITPRKLSSPFLIINDNTHI